MKKNCLFLLVICAIILLNIAIYFLIVTFNSFSELSLSRKKSKQNLIFSKVENSFISTIEVNKFDLRYLNWYPKIILHNEFISYLNSKNVKCIFTNSKGNREERTFTITQNLAFTVGPLTEGDNFVELCFESDCIDDLKMTASMIYHETSNNALPWVYLIQAIISALLFSLCFIQLYKFLKNRFKTTANPKY